MGSVAVVADWEKLTEHAFELIQPTREIQSGLDPVEAFCHRSELLAHVLLLGPDEEGRQRRRQDAEEGDAHDHQRNSDTLATGRDREPVAIANRRDSDDGPPQSIAEVVDVRSRRVVFGCELEASTGEDDDHGYQQDVLQAAMAEQ
jgi:hypothetical protein